MGSFEFVAALVHAVPALVWVVIAQSSWEMVRSKQPASRFLRLLPVVAAGVGLTYAIFTFVCLLPAEVRDQRQVPALIAFALHDCVLFVMVASARHMAYYFPTPERRPSALWLGVNYGSSAVMCVLALAYLGVVPIAGVPEGFAIYPILRIGYQVVLVGLILLRLLPIIRPGGMSAGVSGWIGVRRADAWFLGGALVSLGGWLALSGVNSWQGTRLWEPTALGLFLDTLIGFGFAASIASRFLGHVIRNVLTILVTGLAAAGICFALLPGVIAMAGEPYAPMIDLAALTVLMVVFVPGQAALRRAVDGSILRRSRSRRHELQGFMQSLSPELGTIECSRRALAELARVMRLRGVALLLVGGEAIAHGEIECSRLDRKNLAAVELPRALLGTELREFPHEFRDALTAADIVGVVPVVSPRGPRGLLLLVTDLLGATFTDEEERALRAFADQLALVLDGADLLAGTVAAQRSLAHAEKLAAIGELAARVAHEIRNPVTAARSLAQQLCRDPASPLNAEHAALIVEEMERVEHRIAALLQYARKEEFRIEPVDVSELARNTKKAFSARFDEAGVAFECDAAGAVMANADRERIRQVLVNLVENGLDALSARDNGRLSMLVSGNNGCAEVRVTDNGPGVAPEALARLFEPFFSLKPKGTGLGLAIAKRIVDAHGGELSVRVVEDGGLSFVVRLPSGRAHLEAKVRDGTFREDLFYRLRVVPILLPTLSERIDDLPLLAEHFLRKAAERTRRPPKTLAPEAYASLSNYDWKGNVRELENALEQAMALAAGDEITVDDLPRRPGRASADEAAGAGADGAFSFRDAKQRVVETFERRFISDALARHGGNVTRAAAEIGLYRQQLQAKLAELGIDPERFRG